jgi:thiol peroxidase
MSVVTLKGKPIQTVGALPKLGSMAPDFTLTKTDLSELTLKQCLGKKTVLSIFPSLDTPTCANSVRHFNVEANKLPNVSVLCVSADLPFAQKRFCAAENLDKVIPVSTFRHPEFGVKYGVVVKEGPMTGLMSRAVVVLDEKGKVIYTQQVEELANEPNYEEVLSVLK